MSSTLAVDVPRAAEPAAVSAHRKRSLFFLGAAAAGVGFAVTLQLGLNSNFVGQELHLSGAQQGLLEAVRETCGIMALFILAALAGLAEPIIAAIMLTLFGVGLASYYSVHDYGWLLVASLVWSQGLHVWMPLPNSMTLSLAEPGRAGRRLGQIGAAGAIGSAAGLAIALLLHHFGLAIRPLWIVAGIPALLAAGACLCIPRQIKTPSQRIVVRARYKLYYALCFLEGWRKQIFIAFAGFLLVRQHHIELTTMLALWLVCQGFGYVASLVVGRIIDRVGEQRTLMSYYATLVLVFIGYATIQRPWVLCTLFVCDNILFTMTMALTTYVNRIAPKDEHTPTLSFGVAMNHVAAVLMPLIGGMLWNYAGYQWAFFLGAGVAVVSIAVAWQLPKGARVVQS